MLSTSYIAHFNAPKFYQVFTFILIFLSHPLLINPIAKELKSPSMKRFNKVVGGAFGISIAMFLFIMTVGFLSFGGNSLGFILNNYSSTDNLATLARFAIGGALLTGYPFTFSAIRDGIYIYIYILKYNL
jgi:amino acid permease